MRNPLDLSVFPDFILQLIESIVEKQKKIVRNKKFSIGRPRLSNPLHLII